MSPGFLQQPVLSLYNKLGNEDTDSSYPLLTLFLSSSYHPWPLLLVTCAAAKLPPPSSDMRHTHADTQCLAYLSIQWGRSSGNCYLHNCLDFTHPFIHIGRVLTSIIRISRAAVCAQVVHCWLCLHVQVLACLSIL